MPTLSSFFFVAVALLAGSQVCLAGDADGGDYGLRTEPTVPLAGQPFYVVADGRQCLWFFDDQPYGPGYERVTLGPSLIQARIGVQVEVVFGGMPCSTTGPHTVRVQVPGQQPGAYRLELLGRSPFGPDESEFLQAIDIVIAVAEPVAIPVSNLVATGWLAFLICTVGLGASGCVVRRVA